MSTASSTEQQTQVPAAVLADAEAAAALRAYGEVERRSLSTGFNTVLMALMLRFAVDHTPASSTIVSACLATMVVFTAVRFAVAPRLMRLDARSRARRLGMFAPLVVQVVIWSGLTSWSALAHGGFGYASFLVAMFGLSATMVLIGYSATPRLTLLWVALLLLPLGGTLWLLGPAETHPLGAGALLYGALLSSYVPRVARERRASLLTLLLLEERARAFEQARDAAVQAAAARDAFHANLSHEIRTPLNGLVGVVDRLRRTELSNEQRESLNQLDRCGQSLLLILNDALDAVSMEAGKLKLRAEPFALDVLVDEAVALFLAQATAKGLTLRVARAGGERSLARRVVGDSQRIRQVLQNLVGNAVKFTDRGEVTVEAAVDVIDAGHVRLEIAVVDTGAGFDHDEAGRLFQRFGQGGEGARRGGTGLGLAIAHDLVTLMGGTLSGESRGRGHGARFVLRVPLALAAKANGGNVRGRRVLVVDDNPRNLAIARAYLEVLGCVVDRASRGHEGVELAARNRYDAIVMDCLMPGMSGFEAAVALREHGVDTPIIACTAADDPETARASREAGMQVLVHKPVSSESLEAALLRVQPSVAVVVAPADSPTA
jgi:signal transduction histidine kinase/ActR/RegA family two-component response regulator